MYYKKFEAYKRLTKFKQRKFKENLTQMINGVRKTRSTKSMEIIDVLKRESVSTDKESTYKAEKVNHQKLFDHFHNLLNSEKSNIDTDRQNYVKQELNNYE